MEKKEEILVFNTPKNFKRGKYLLSRYRLKDLVIMVAIMLISLAAIIVYLTLFPDQDMQIHLLVVILLLLPIGGVYLLFMSMPVYLNLFEYITAFFFFRRKQKKFKWEGIYLDEKEVMIDYEESEE